MKNGSCPKCQSSSVYKSVGNPHQREQVTLSGGIVTQAAAPDRYVCTSCGYVEFYLSAQKHLQVVQENWEKV